MNAPTRDEFLARRRAGIGGSDIAAVLGLSPYKTPLQLWMEKTGRDVTEPDADAQERMHWGVVLEDVVAKHYAQKAGVKVQRINDQLALPSCPIAVMNADRFVLESGKRARWDDDAGRVLGASRILEVKTAHALAQNSADWGAAGTDEVPQHYWTQCVWYMGIAGIDVADVAVLFGGQRFVTYTIALDRQIFDDMVSEADSWWKRHVVADLPPAPSTEDDARRLWTSHIAGRERIVDATVADAVEKLAAIKATLKLGEEAAQAQRDIICTAFGDAEAISYMGRKLATWKQNKAGSKTDWKAAAEELAGYVPIAEKIIAKHTTQTDGARVLRLATSKE